MIDEKRVLQVAKELSMNPDKARKAPGGCQIRTGNPGTGT